MGNPGLRAAGSQHAGAVRTRREQPSELPPRPPWTPVSTAGSPIARVRVATIHVVLPAYNEAESLPALLTRLEAFRSEYEPQYHHLLKVWVIDDGSTDDTRSLAQQHYGLLGVNVVSHPRNRGLGPAIQTGLRHAADAAHPDDVVVVMDADDTHDVALIRALVAQLEQGADIAIASRFVPGGDDATAPPLRRLLSRLAAVVFRILLPVPEVRDLTTGYRAYRASLLQRADAHFGERLVEERGFAVMVELLLKLRHWHPVIVEVPLVLRYDRKGGSSKLRIGRTVGQYLRLIARDRLAPAPAGLR